VTKDEAWKRGDRGTPERRFVVPKVYDEDDYETLANDVDSYARAQRDRSVAVKRLSGVFGLLLIIAFYTFALFVVLRTLDITSLSYRECAIVVSCFVFVRYTDAYIISESSKNRR
jgi:hypothetical protein